jgi:DNA (cytosine-5)-methyltransferase 1
MKHASLFSGIGGFDLAAEWMGWENVFHCEWNNFGQKVLKYYWPNAISYHDITKTDFTIYRGTIDILTGGFPCQPYSVAGKRLGKEDERHLWPEMLRAIREIAPTYVVGENVRGLLSWNGGMVFDEVQADLEAEGYEVIPFILPACAVDAPHRRDRVWFVAKNTGSNGRSNGKHDEQINFGNIGKFSTGSEERIFGNEIEQDATNTESKGSTRQSIGTQTPHSINGINGINGNATDTISIRGRKNERIGNGEPNEHDQIDSPGTWQNFPTQSPICNGDDGFPARLDGITFPKWRNESIKAGGNAIVPQVAYQIFKAIELTI